MVHSFFIFRARVLLVILLFTYFGTSVTAKTIVYIRVSFKECLSCANSLQALQKLPLSQANTKTIFVFQKEDIQNIKTYREKYIETLPTGLNYTTLASDKIYNRLSQRRYSTIHIVSDKREIFTCPLKELGVKWPLAAAKINEASTPKEWKHLPLPKTFRIYASPSSIYFFDSEFEDLFYLDKLSGDFKKLSVSKEEAVDQLAVYFGQYPEKKRVHDSLVPFTKMAMMNRPAGIGSVGICGDTLIVINTVEYVEKGSYEGQATMNWTKCLFITAYYQDSVLYRKVIDIPDWKYYDFDETAGISADDSFYYISIYAMVIGSKNPMVAKWKRTSGNFVRFAEGVRLSLPNYYVRNNLGYDFFELLFSQPYFMVPLSNNLYSVWSDNDSVALPLKMDRNDFSKLEDGIATFGMYVVGLEHTGTVIHVLYYDTKNYRYARYDLAAKKLLQDTPIFGIDKIENFPSFDGPYHVVYCRKGSKTLIRETLSVKSGQVKSSGSNSHQPNSREDNSHQYNKGERK